MLHLQFVLYNSLLSHLPFHKVHFRAKTSGFAVFNNNRKQHKKKRKESTVKESDDSSVVCTRHLEGGSVNSRPTCKQHCRTELHQTANCKVKKVKIVREKTTTATAATVTITTIKVN